MVEKGEDFARKLRNYAEEWEEERIANNINENAH